MDIPTPTEINAIIVSLTSLVAAVASTWALIQGKSNNADIKAMDTKVISVEGKVDGHMSKLTEMAASVDPAIAALAAQQVLETAKEARSNSPGPTIATSSIPVVALPAVGDEPAKIVALPSVGKP